MHENLPRPVFTADDVDRLARSAAWQAQPELVEALCRTLYELDPMGLRSGENPHAMTEYLAEVDMLVERIPSVRSENDLSVVISTIFDEMFDGAQPTLGWEGVAAATWPTVSGAHARGC